MKSDFYNQIANSNAHRWQRDLNCETALANPLNLSELFEMSFAVSDINHFKACWALELVLEQKIELLLPYLDQFCAKVKLYKNDSALRSISKICWFISTSNSKLLKEQEQQLLESCLDWLIQNEKVATKVYAMRALYNFSKTHHWLVLELQTILTQDYAQHTAAYKAAAKDILKKLKK